MALVRAKVDGAVGRTLDPAVPTVERLVKDSVLPKTKTKTVLVSHTVWIARNGFAAPTNAMVSE